VLVAAAQDEERALLRETLLAEHAQAAVELEHLGDFLCADM